MKDTSIPISELQYVLIDSLYSSPKCHINNASCDKKHDWNFVNKDNKIRISGNIVKPLTEYLKEVKYLNYTKTLRLIICIGIQLQILMDYGHGITSFDPEDILVIDENWFLIVNLSNIAELTRDKNVKIIKPITEKNFLAPELTTIKVLPSEVYYTCAYYSLAKMCIELYGFQYISRDADLHLEIINNTPLYYLLKRCLDKDPKKRSFLLL